MDNILNTLSSLDDKDLIKVIQAAKQELNNRHQSNDDSEFVKKPHYGMLTFSRAHVGNTKDGAGLFGSNIPHRNVISVTLKHASEQRHDGHSAYFEESLIAEAFMSYAQFAEAVTTSTNVPVTLTYTETDGVIKLPEAPDNAELLSEDYKQHIDECTKNVEDVQSRLETLFAKKTLSKNDKDELIGLVATLKRNLGVNTESLVKKHHAHIEKTVAEAKGEIEAFVQNKMNNIAIETLAKSPENTKHITDEGA